MLTKLAPKQNIAVKKVIVENIILEENKIIIATAMSLKQMVITACLVTIAKPIIKEFCNADVDYVIDKSKFKISIAKSAEAPFLLK